MPKLHSTDTTKTHKIYIAGKIGALGVSVMRHRFDAAARLLKRFNWATVNPCDIEGDVASENRTWQQCMIADLHELLDCDAVFALRGWHKSNGAKIEVNLAQKLKKPVLFESIVCYGNYGNYGNSGELQPRYCLCFDCARDGLRNYI